MGQKRIVKKLSMKQNKVLDDLIIDSPHVELISRDEEIIPLQCKPKEVEVQPQWMSWKHIEWQHMDIIVEIKGGPLQFDGFNGQPQEK